MSKRKKQSNNILLGLLLIPLLCCFLFGLLINATESTSENKNNDSLQIDSAKDTKLYKVTKVIDGDTIEVELDAKTEKVRLIGIDTPESVHPEKPVECFAIEASNRLKELIENKEVLLVSDDSQANEDKYGRLLRYVSLPNGDFINFIMIRQGFAHEYTYNNNLYEYQNEFKEAEKFAKDNNYGLWGNSCQCVKDNEISRKCISCNTLKIEYTNWDCSTYSKDVEDTTCQSLCNIPEVKSEPAVPIIPPAPAPQPQVPQISTGYTCNCSKTCPNLSCAEAQYQLNTCGCSARDADNDGYACDKQCGY